MQVTLATVFTNPAEEFLTANLAEFGLLGDNNRVASDVAKSPLPPRQEETTKGDHFRFGFNGREFNYKTSHSGKYWVEYGRPGRPHQGFESEFALALEEIHGRVGQFSITATSSYIAAAASMMARLKSLPFRQIVVDFEGFRPVAFDERIPIDRIETKWEEFQEFALVFASAAACADPWIALEAFHGAKSELPHIYDGHEIRIINNSFDETARLIVGPPDWALVDNEKFTAIDRFLAAEQRTGVTQLLRWSPELMAAQIDSIQTRDWLRRASRVKNSTGGLGWLNQRARLQLIRATFPGLETAKDVKASRSDPLLDQHMLALSRRMRRIAPGYRSQHRYPLRRLLERLGVSFDFFIGEVPSIYGVVNG